MIPDLAHRVSVFGLLKPVACGVPVKAKKDRDPLHVPQRDGGEGLNSRLFVDTPSLNGRYVEQIWATCFPITRTSQDARPFLARANNIALTGIDSVEYRRHVAGCVP